MSNPIRFYLRVNGLLSQRGLSQHKMELGCGVSRHTIYRGPKTKTPVAALAYYFGITMEELVEGTDAEWVLEQ